MSPAYTVAALGVAAILVLVLLNAYFVATEFSLVAVRRSQVKLWERERRRGAAATARALGRLDDSIAATQLGITVASIGLGFLGEPALAGLLRPALATGSASRAPPPSTPPRSVVAFALVTFLHVVVGELAPKALALDRPGPRRPRLLPAAAALLEAHPAGALGDERLRQRAGARLRHPAGRRGRPRPHLRGAPAARSPRPAPRA